MIVCLVAACIHTLNRLVLVAGIFATRGGLLKYGIRSATAVSIEPVTKRLRPVIRNFFIATDLITTLATNMGLKMLPFYHEDCFELFF